MVSVELSGCFKRGSWAGRRAAQGPRGPVSSLRSSPRQSALRFALPCATRLIPRRGLIPRNRAINSTEKTS